MTCEQMRVALSARLDGEAAGVADPVLDAHLVECTGCRDWLAQAERVTQAVRAQPVEVPDLTAAVLAAVAADPKAPRRTRAAATNAAAANAATTADVARHGRQQILRLAVAVAAAAQLVLAVPVLLTGASLATDPHSSREMASFDVALAVGFALAAWRPQRARAFVPVAFVLAACLAVTTAVDLANSTTALLHEVGHLAAVAQAALLWALGRSSDGTPGRRSGHGWSGRRSGAGTPAVPA
jgi:predicted anti-sigma-YlaC factor YlaD